MNRIKLWGRHRTGLQSASANHKQFFNYLNSVRAARIFWGLWHNTAGVIKETTSQVRERGGNEGKLSLSVWHSRRKLKSQTMGDQQGRGRGEIQSNEVAVCLYLKTLTATASWKTTHLGWERRGERESQLSWAGTKNHVERLLVYLLSLMTFSPHLSVL